MSFVYIGISSKIMKTVQTGLDFSHELILSPGKSCDDFSHGMTGQKMSQENSFFLLLLCQKKFTKHDEIKCI